MTVGQSQRLEAARGVIQVEQEEWTLKEQALIASLILCHDLTVAETEPAQAALTQQEDLPEVLTVMIVDRP